MPRRTSRSSALDISRPYCRSSSPRQTRYARTAASMLSGAVSAPSGSSRWRYSRGKCCSTRSSRPTLALVAKPPVPLPEVGFDGGQSFLARLHRRLRLLRMLEEQVLDLRRAAKDEHVDGEVAQRLPLRRERLKRREERSQVTRHRGEVRRLNSEVPVGEMLVSAPRPRPGQLNARHGPMPRNHRDRPLHKLSHARVIAADGRASSLGGSSHARSIDLGVAKHANVLARPTVRRRPLAEAVRSIDDGMGVG